MPYNSNLADRIREHFASLPNVIEKEMMGGLTIMYNNKMCVGIIKDELMCRVDPALHDSCVEKNGCRTMDFTKRPMRGYIMIEPQAIQSRQQLAYWLELAIDFNAKAKSSKKKK